MIEHDADGTWEVETTGGVRVRRLITPSQAYLDRMAAEEAAREAERAAKLAEEEAERVAKEDAFRSIGNAGNVAQLRAALVAYLTTYT